jgi:uncharacterized repeat protein (TIGR01451 family)
LPPLPSTPIAPDEPTAPPVTFDDEIQPAQFTTPLQTFPGNNAPARPIADPPAPLVRIQVRVPADSPPGDDIKYLITVQNTSSADAHRVMVRNPLPDSIEAPPGDRQGACPDSSIYIAG